MHADARARARAEGVKGQLRGGGAVKGVEPAGGVEAVCTLAFSFV
jgi:hypothetical protein